MTVRPRIILERDARGIAVLTVDRPAKLNILNTTLMTELVNRVDRLAEDAGLRALVLRGAGDRAFIGGADIDEMADLDAQSARRFITLVHRCCDAFRRLPVPVIARIHGYVLGAGLEIAAACDFRIAGADARFGMPEVRVGIPSVVEAALLPQLIGWGRTRLLMMTGDIIDAATARDWGLVEDVVPVDGLDDAVERRLTSILAAGPRAVRLQKQLITAWEDLPLRAAIERGIDSFVSSWEGDEPRRLMRDFLDQRRRRKLAAGRTENPE